MATCTTDNDCQPGTQCVDGSCIIPSGTQCTAEKMSYNKNVSSAISAVLFGVLSSAPAYKLSNAVFAPMGLPTLDDLRGCPTVFGMFIHGVAFTGVTRILMDHVPSCDFRQPSNNKDKWVTSLMGGALFILVSSPYAYAFTSGLSTAVFGPSGQLADDDGCPNVTGIVTHSVVYGLLVRFLMRG